MTDLALRSTEIADRIGDVLDILADDNASIEDKGAAYAIGAAVVREIQRGLGTYIRSGPTAKSELTEHLVRNGGELGPLYLGWEAFDVAYPINDAGNWTDEQAQSDLASLPREFLREVPAHLEVDVAALGTAVHDGSTSARAVWEFLKVKRYRIEGGKRAVLKVREPKKGKAA
jgi:hypothetical protein